MAGTAVRGRLSWIEAEVVAVTDEAPSVRTITFQCPGWPGHLPGQHVDVRLVAPDGYQAQRSYSIAMPQDGERVTLTVERLVDGEVSGYLVGELRVGDVIELRGPIGGYFVWEPSYGGPLLLLAGGSGVVPLMAMLRDRVATDSDVPVRLVHSSRSWERSIYREELAQLNDAGGVEVVPTITGTPPSGWTGYARRVDRDMLADVSFSATEAPLVYICGPTGFVESVANAMVSLGHDPRRIRTERFGPTGTSG
jgi:ferredoxin-NADP reductase